MKVKSIKLHMKKYNVFYWFSFELNEDNIGFFCILPTQSVYNTILLITSYYLK